MSELKPVSLNPDALTRLIRNIYVENVQLNLEYNPKKQLALEAFLEQFFGTSLTLNQIVRIARGEARLKACLRPGDNASWLAYDDSDRANIRAQILKYVETYAGGGGVHWEEITAGLTLHKIDRVVLFDLERERLVTSTTSDGDAGDEIRYFITTAGRIALVEGRS